MERELAVHEVDHGGEVLGGAVAAGSGLGGLAPRYIVDSPPPGVPEHTGTTDLDVVVGLQIEVAADGVYTKLQQELGNTNFRESDEGSWAWERWGSLDLPPAVGRISR